MPGEKVKTRTLDTEGCGTRRIKQNPKGCGTRERLGALRMSHPPNPKAMLLKVQRFKEREKG
jgi:hypothetical protein